MPAMFCLLLALMTAPPTYELRNGHWLTPRGFEARTTWVMNGRITLRRPAQIDSVIDLQGGYVTPPFGEAHNHNMEFSTPARTDTVIASYLREGVFYVKNPGIVTRGRDSMMTRVNKPTSVDAIFSLGLLTATGGHPTRLWKRNVERGGMTVAEGDGGFMWIIDTRADLASKFPKLVAQRPDFIKAILIFSEEYEKRRKDPSDSDWRGLNPALMPEIVRRAHAAGLRVSAHVESAADFHVAVAAGVDEINHIPGFRGNEQTQIPRPEVFQIAPADAKRAAAQNIVVVTTLGGIGSVSRTGADSLQRRAFDDLARHNLRVLRGAGVKLALGSDGYRDNSTGEVKYLRELGVFSNMELLRLWSEATPQAIFPKRKVGCLAENCEASFQVFAGSPAVDWSNLKNARLRMKDGYILK